MSDLIKALEADLYGAYEWAADLYEDLRDVPEPVDRLLIMQGLFRAYENLESRDDDAARAVADMAEAEDAVPSDVRERLDALASAREALLDAEDTVAQAEALAPDYLARFDELWDAEDREVLVADAIVAALTHMGLLAGRMRSRPEESVDAAKVQYHAAAELYSAVATLLESRVQKGEIIWQETARSAWHRARAAWRAAGEEEKARMADSAARGLGGALPTEAGAHIAEERAKGKLASDDVRERVG